MPSIYRPTVQPRPRERGTPRVRGAGRLTRTGVISLALLLAGLVLTAPPVHAATYQPPASPRQDLLLNDGWRFKRSSSGGEQSVGHNDSGAAWSTVNVPHTWNSRDGQDGGDNYYRGATWYRKRFTVPASYSGRQLFLQFAGVNKVADVYVNGTLVGRHEGGFARFRLQATAQLRPGEENLLAVRVDNGEGLDIAPLDGDFTQFGGIYRNVRLISLDPVHTAMQGLSGDGVYLHQRRVSSASADVDVETRLFNDSAGPRSVTVRTVVTGTGGVVVADRTSNVRMETKTGTDVVQPLTVSNPRLWNGRQDPFLYSVHVEIRNAGDRRLLDAASLQLGLRTVAVNPTTGFELNGANYELRGVNMHQDLQDHGWAVSDADHARDFELMNEMGVNSIRLAHYQHDQYVYNRADREGHVVYTEVPLINTLGSNSAAFRANVHQQMRELIDQNYNHPSVAFWGIGNELRGGSAAQVSLLDELDTVVRREDPSRITTYAHCCGGDTSAVASQAETAGYNRYFGWYSGTATDIGSWADNLHRTSPDRIIGVTEYGAGGSTLEHVDNPAPQPSGNVNAPGTPHTEEYQQLLHERHWAAFRSRDYLFGTWVWNMFDFASDDRNEGDTAGRNDKGLVTYDRQTRKDAFWFYRANWSSLPTLHLGSARYNPRTNPLTEIKAYANTGPVTLRVNGRVIGTKTPALGVVSWKDVRLSPGDNVVQVSASRSGTALADTVTWTLVD